jgi:hypothetical protein
MEANNTSPLRHRDNMNAQSLIDCNMDQCIQIEASVDRSLERFER